MEMHGKTKSAMKQNRWQENYSQPPNAPICFIFCSALPETVRVCVCVCVLVGSQADRKPYPVATLRVSCEQHVRLLHKPNHHHTTTTHQVDPPLRQTFTVCTDFSRSHILLFHCYFFIASFFWFGVHQTANKKKKRHLGNAAQTAVLLCTT